MSGEPRAKNPALRTLGWILLFGLLSGLISCLAAYGILEKWFVPWRALPSLPEDAKSIAGATLTTIDVETQSGRFMRCEPRGDAPCWTPVSAPETETDSGCESLNRSRQLQDIIDQRLVCRYYADGADITIYALRADGRVYTWRAGGSGYEVLLLYILPAICAPLGMALGLVVGPIRGRKRVEEPVQ